jgi:hypothetical protein
MGNYHNSGNLQFYNSASLFVAVVQQAAYNVVMKREVPEKHSGRENGILLRMDYVYRCGVCGCERSYPDKWFVYDKRNFTKPQVELPRVKQTKQFGLVCGQCQENYFTDWRG